MSGEVKEKRTISPLDLPQSVREKLPEAKRDYKKALIIRNILILSLIFFIIVVIIIACS